MSTKSERDKLKTQQEKFQAILSGLLKDDDNKYCVDCDAKGPRWASWNLGIFLCIRCAGIHRNLGVHITKVKSVNLDTWSPEQLAMMMEVGNSRARAAYEANIPDNYKRPQTNSGLESFIRAKYETKKYMAKEWIPPKPTVPRELVSELLEDDKDKKKSRTKATGSIQLNPAPRAQSNSTTPAVSQSSKSENKPAKSAQPKPVTAPAVVQAKPPQPSSNTADLIGLEAPAAPQQTNNNLLGDLNDFMGSGGPASPLGGGENQTVNNGQIANGGLEANLFEDMNGGSSGGGTQSKSSKDSIMALFSSGGSQQPQQFGVPGGMYVAPQQNMGAMYGMPQQQQPQQQQQQQQQPMMSAAGNVPMQPPPMYGSQMSGQRMPANMGMQQGNMGMQQGNVGMPQGNMGMQPTMGMQQGNMGVYGQQPQMQQMQFQQMQQQMAGMQVGQGGQMMGGTGGIAQNGVPAGQGWGAPPSSGHTLQSNLWH